MRTTPTLPLRLLPLALAAGFAHAAEVPIPKSDGDVTLINNHEGLVELYNSIELLRVQEII